MKRWGFSFHRGGWCCLSSSLPNGAGMARLRGSSLVLRGTHLLLKIASTRPRLPRPRTLRPDQLPPGAAKRRRLPRLPPAPFSTPESAGFRRTKRCARPAWKSCCRRLCRAFGDGARIRHLRRLAHPIPGHVLSKWGPELFAVGHPPTKCRSRFSYVVVAKGQKSVTQLLNFYSL